MSWDPQLDGVVRPVEEIKGTGSISRWDSGRGGIIRHPDEMFMGELRSADRLLNHSLNPWPEKAAPLTWRNKWGRVMQWGYASKEEAAVAREQFEQPTAPEWDLMRKLEAMGAGLLRDPSVFVQMAAGATYPQGRPPVGSMPAEASGPALSNQDRILRDYPNSPEAQLIRLQRARHALPAYLLPHRNGEGS